MRVLTCPFCHEEFEAHQPTQYACGKEACQRERKRRGDLKSYNDGNHRRKPVVLKERPCRYCGAMFKSKYSATEWCHDKECQSKHRREYDAERRRGERQRQHKMHDVSPYRRTKPSLTTKTVLCLRCDHPFESDGKGNRICPPCRDINAYYGDRVIEFDLGIYQTENV